MLVTLSEILNKAERGKYAVIAPDFTTMASIRFHLEAAEEFKAPLILSYMKHMRPLCPVRSWEKWINLIREECGHYEIDVCLHLDHGTTVEECCHAVDSGFTGVMIDASVKPNSENIEITSRVVEYAHAVGVSVEAEIGHVGFAEKDTSHTENPGESHLTHPDQAGKFARQTGADCLAVAIGTVHGEYVGEPDIDFPLLDEINRLVPIPLVLHGGSGTGDKNIKQAVSLGIRKINVFSDWIVPSQRETSRLIAKNPKDVASIADTQQSIIRDTLAHWFHISGSVNQG